MDQESCESQCSTTVSDVLRLSRDKTVSDVLGSDNYLLGCGLTVSVEIDSTACLVPQSVGCLLLALSAVDKTSGVYCIAAVFLCIVLAYEL
jgi:hypothetical protein